MAEVDPEPIDGEQEGDKQGAAQPRKHDEQHAAALDKVTDYVEEQLITGDIGKVTQWSRELLVTAHVVECNVSTLNMMLRRCQTLEVTSLNRKKQEH